MDKELKTLFLDADKINIDTSLALRFLRVRRELDENAKQLVLECLSEFEKAVFYKACYRYFDISIDGKKVVFDNGVSFESEKLAKNLDGCKGAFLFVATAGINADRLIKKYSSLMVSKALVLDAIGSAAVEGFCDVMCKKIRQEYGVSFRPRFSPGYGDLSVLCQSQILNLLDANKQIGITLTDSNMMIPSKSVSAIVGVRPKSEQCKNATDCDCCDEQNCPYRD